MKKGTLHVLSNGKQQPEQLAEIAGRIHPYVDAIHIREKTKTAKEIYELAALLLKHQVPPTKVFINDRVDIAYVLKTGGVHLAYHSLPPDVVKRKFPSLKVGCSVHSINEAQKAQEQGSNYVFFGHVFPTQSKPDIVPRGLEQLALTCSSVSIPVLAIGGIKPANVREAIEKGAAGVAVMSGVLDAEDPLEAVKQYHLKLTN
ncbi:thiazole tautomerase TenI [Aquibacillus sp. 3ASR75-11]|uniref:Thiazole tautomerase TenI n=1 Tax=Terrihalobacillus insolitus TaxID=2950438 RepID=A0A9X3WUT2_9BACI|nr:thiazole tautomerase TenI [Terrihalobacillus insolitus]MDC3413492.1 thiazole tautomerase TenI [Terrihalobacillus insolitus]MDC3425218.1 thiazole tautomerase TenI [Terrihalobacillus insolitus]